MVNHTFLILEKESLMTELLVNLSQWDESMDEAVKIMNKNNQLIQAMQEMDKELTKEILDEYNKKHKGTWQEIISEQEKLNKVIRAQKYKVEEQLIQLGKKDKVISNYISLQENSVFIEENY